VNGVSFVVNFRLLMFSVVRFESEVNSEVSSVIALESFVYFLDVLVSSANVTFGQSCPE